MVLQREGPDIRVATSQGTVRARQLILATNGYSARQPLTRSLRQRLIPFRSANRLARDMMGAFPELDGVKIDYRWSGLVAMTMDQLPHAGELEDRVFFAAGYNGTGIAMSSFLGRQLAALTRGEKLQLGLIGRPLKPIPLQAFVTPAVRTVTGWYQLLDAIGR